jgi:hypothetical protein
MVYRTMQGREIDLEKLISQNELSPAIGNMRVNARGDELGPGGKIVRSREEIVNEYYEPNTVKRTSARPAEAAESLPEPAVPEYYEGLDEERPVVKTKKTED